MVDKGTIDGIDYRFAGEGPPLIVLHGGGANADALLGLAQLVGQKHRVIAPNLAGYGSTPPAPPTAPALEVHLQVVEQAFALAGDAQFDLLGHSMGGMLALKAAARTPDRIRRLVAVEPMCFGALLTGDETDTAALDEDRAVIDYLVQQVDAGNVEAGVAAFIDYWGGAPWHTLPERIQTRLIALGPQLRREAQATSYDPTPAATYAGLGQKTLLLAGSTSPLPARRIVQRLAEAMPGARSKTIAEAGHMAVVTKPDLFADAINAWLSPA